jgi:hypothetical protein
VNSVDSRDSAHQVSNVFPEDCFWVVRFHNLHRTKYGRPNMVA